MGVRQQSSLSGWPENIWNSWRMMAVGLLLVGATVLVTTLVGGYRGDPASSQPPGSASYSSTTGQKVSLPRQIDMECKAYADSSCMHRRRY